MITLFHRTDTILRTLDALQRCYKIQEYELIKVRQKGNLDECAINKKIVDSIDWIPVHHLETSYADTDTIIKKLNSNIFMGFSYGFETLNADLVLFIDDILLGYDTLEFHETLTEKYCNDPFFRAVCSFSNNKFKQDHLYCYSKFRFGIGKGWSISRKKWFSIFKKIIYQHNNSFYDAQCETECKMGYVILPFCSRMNDIGYGEKKIIQGFTKDKLHCVKESWVNSDPFPLKPYRYLKNIEFELSKKRPDCVYFSWYSPFVFIIKRLIRKIMFLIGMPVKSM